MSYDEFLSRISQRFASYFADISAEHNFEFGPEFEIAVCKGLRAMLPVKCGVCRGYIATADGRAAGDDIIIYDQNRFPTLRLLESADFSQKQRVPIEAVYAYIEAKHTLVLQGTGGQSFTKAAAQIAAVKALGRSKVPLSQIGPYTFVEPTKNAGQPAWPDHRNPLLCMILSRFVRQEERGEPQASASMRQPLAALAQAASTTPGSPDIIIAGSDLISLPVVGQQSVSPFLITGTTELGTAHSEGQALAIGLSLLSWAIDWVHLAAIYWPGIIAKGLGVPLEHDLRNSAT